MFYLHSCFFPSEDHILFSSSGFMLMCYLKFFCLSVRESNFEQYSLADTSVLPTLSSRSRLSEAFFQVSSMFCLNFGIN